MVKIFNIEIVFYLNLFKYTVLCEDTHVVITGAKYESFLHNMEETYFLDKNETIEVWAKVVPFPWQDNRLIPGISDSFLLELNASCVEEVVSKGVVTRNMTVEISQVSRNASASSIEDKTGNATFHIGIFEETQEEPLRVETEIIVGCPPGRNMSVYRHVENCSAFENYTFTIPSGHYRSDSPSTQATIPKTMQYNFPSLGCPLESNYYDVFKPKLQLYSNGEFLRNVTANYVVFELNGRSDYSFSASMAEVGCLHEAQTYQKMIDGGTHLSDLSLAWKPQNYESCFDSAVQNGDLDQPYEILNETGLSALIWQSEGVYVFRATVVDPEYRHDVFPQPLPSTDRYSKLVSAWKTDGWTVTISQKLFRPKKFPHQGALSVCSFCNLTTVFAVRVSGIEREGEELIPFLVLGTSAFGLLSVIFIVFVTSK